MTKQEQIEEMAKIIRKYYPGFCNINVAEKLYNASYRKISENAVVLTEEEYANFKFATDKYDPFWFCSFGGCEGVCKECNDTCEKSIFVQERKKTAKEILLPLREFLIKRFDYFGELAKRNEAVSPDNRLFDLGEQDMANCTLDRVKEFLAKYGVEVEE